MDVDTTLKESRPNDARWDYGIGLRNQGNEKVVWVEIHPASSLHLDDVFKKLAWLKDFLRRSAPALRALTTYENGPRFIWIATGSVGFRAGSQEMRKIAASGIHFAGTHHKF